MCSRGKRATQIQVNELGGACPALRSGVHRSGQAGPCLSLGGQMLFLGWRWNPLQAGEQRRDKDLFSIFKGALRLLGRDFRRPKVDKTLLK